MNDSLRDQLGVQSPEKIEYLKMLIFGESGAGKTTVLGTAQDSELSSPVLLIDVEGGSTVLSDKPKVDVKQIRSTDGVQKIADILHKHPKYYKTVQLDSLTDFREINMSEVMHEQYNKKPETTDLYVPSPREWGKSGAQIKEILRYLKDLPCHVVVTTLMEDKKDEKTGKITTEPMLPGQLRKHVPGFFDVVGYLRVMPDGTRTMQFKKTERMMCKDRTKALPDLMPNPTIPEIWETIFKAGATIDRTVSDELLATVATNNNKE